MDYAWKLIESHRAHNNENQQPWCVIFVVVFTGGSQSRLSLLYLTRVLEFIKCCKLLQVEGPFKLILCFNTRELVSRVCCLLFSSSACYSDITRCFHWSDVHCVCCCLRYPINSGHIHTSQFLSGISRNTQLNNHMLSLS